MVGGIVIEVHPMGEKTRLWCVDRMDECAVYADGADLATLPRLGDAIWWQAGKIYWDRDCKTCRKVGYSFDPLEAA